MTTNVFAMLSLLCISSAALAADPETAFVLVQKDKDFQQVQLPESIHLQTSFGAAEILREQIDEVFGGESLVIVTRDGTRLKGTLDWSKADVKTADGTLITSLPAKASWQAVRHATLVAGEVTAGRTANRLNYELRAPIDFSPEKKLPALILLHGSNMNSHAYLQTVLSTWPDLAERYVLIGIDGEYRTVAANGQLSFNYSYVNFVGKSKFKGYPGTDRESPALVAELLTELKARLPIDRVILLGHSQGAFLTYSVLMNYPELISGAIPVSGGMIVQAVPSAFDNAELIALQQRIPIAVVHGKSDPNVSFKLAESAMDVLTKAEYRSKLFAHDTAGHAFALLPIPDAIKWIEEESAKP